MYAGALAFEIFGALLAVCCLFAAWFMIHEAPGMITGFNAREFVWQTWGLSIMIGLAFLLAGHSYAENLRTQAHLLLCQVEIERNTANLVHDAIQQKPMPTPDPEPEKETVA